VLVARCTDILLRGTATAKRAERRCEAAIAVQSHLLACTTLSLSRESKSLESLDAKLAVIFEQIRELRVFN